MSCPDWVRLGEDSGRVRESSPEWRAALDHMDGCESCRDDALRADPTLVFRRLPSFAVGADEIAAMKDSVAALRRAGDVTARLSPPPAERYHPWRRAAAAAVLLAAALLALPTGQNPEERAKESIASLPAEPFPGAADTMERPVTEELPYIEELPHIEELDLPAARVYHLAEGGLPVVFIVDESLDV